MVSACFNPRTRKGATNHGFFRPTLADVSIHAPVRVRPFGLRAGLGDVLVSIHAPVRVRHEDELPFKAREFEFQSTHP